MSRNRSSKNDWRRFRKFEQENATLKKEVSKLRKLVNSLALVDQLEERAENIQQGKPPITKVCERCGNDDLTDMSIKRPDGEWEIMICKSCQHRSQMKKVK